MDANVNIGVNINMNKTEIIEILLDWNFWKKDIYTGVRREKVLNRMKKLAKMKEIVVVSGARRSGKSTIIVQFCSDLIKKGARREDILIINFEDPRFRNMNLDLLNRIYDVYRSEVCPEPKEQYVVLDEIQIVNGWEKFARFLHENKKAHVFVTGSSSKLLSSEYATVLSGRHVDVEMYPLSFLEFLEFKDAGIKSRLDATAKRHVIKKLFSEYMRLGGFPKIALVDDFENKKELLNSYFRDIIIKDVVLRYRIKDVEKLEDLARYYLSNISSVQSFNKIKNVLGLSLDTVERYSSYLSNAYFVFFVKKFSYSVKEQILNPRKVYCIDTGLRNAAGFVFSKDEGRLMENIVFLELKKRGSEVYYWKDSKQKEVDFVVKENEEIKCAIQVCWNLDNEKTRMREISALVSAIKELGLKEGLIITEDYEDEVKIDSKKIKFVPLYKWLIG